jgi:GrpB-like predicted nucleotidyltransferase (UPF0157 family)
MNELHKFDLTLTDALTGYLTGKSVNRGLWQCLDQPTRARLAHAMVAAKPKTPTEVRLCDYDIEWPRLFSQIERELRQQVGTLALAIEHVGSTSVPGLAAKPIIDIELIIVSAYQFPPVKERLENFGYIHRGPCGVPDRDVFRCVIDLPPHHLYVCQTGARSLRERLCFRDVLRQSPQLAAEYAALKRNLAEQYLNNRNAYTEAKTGFVRSVIAASLTR